MPKLVFLMPRISSCLIVLSFLFSYGAFGQVIATDSIQQLSEVSVHGYLSRQPLLQTPASVGILNTELLNKNPGQSLVPALNLIPGVRMEERSPGSYRLSIRGSLLRSPFGVRNVKVYMDEFPLTDASGNTYINLIDTKAIERIEILKGPDGSLFGANSGGVVLMDLVGQKRDSNEIAVGLNGGSYGLFHENASLKNVAGKSQFSFNQAYQRSDGYRENTAMQRHYLQAAERWSYGNNNSVKALAFYSDLQYRTPGGLTQAQYDADPQQARPPAGPNPGASQQQAGIYNKTFFGGITNELHLTDNMRFVASAFGTHTDYKNPFITNYEVRIENNLGIRSYLELTSEENATIDWKWNLGLEGQKGYQNFNNYQNNGGVQGSLLASDKFHVNQIFYYTRLAATVLSRLTAELAVSLNEYNYSYTGLTGKGSKKFDGQWMPRVALNYLLTSDIALRASVSRGYSPPTLAEVRPSNYVINEDLQSELGWNREVGFRLTTWKDRLQVDASVFRYDLTNAIVRRVDAGGAEYFVNAGGTKQTGVESLVSAWLVAPKNSGVVRGLLLNGSYTYSDFLFNDYQDATTDYSGNSLTGVPKSVMVVGVTVQLPRNISLFVQSNSTARIPLNDGNTVYADSYDLLQAKISWSKIHVSKIQLEIFVGADNILDEKYSLGNDTNAFGGRYFNAAAPLNFYGGVNLNFR
jgi:iron complex outermembrane receptor protein